MKQFGEISKINWDVFIETTDISVLAFLRPILQKKVFQMETNIRGSIHIKDMQKINKSKSNCKQGATIVTHVLSNHDVFQKLSMKHQNRLSRLIAGVMVGNFRHDELYPIAEIHAVSLPSKYLQKLFRKKSNSSYYLGVISEYFDCVNSYFKYAGAKTRTKKYELKDWVAKAYLDFYKNNHPITPSYISENSQVPIQVVPPNAINTTDVQGKPKATKIALQPIVKLNMDAIDRTIEDIENSSSKNPRWLVRRGNLIQLYIWKNALNNTLAPSSAIQLYTESEAGRLGSHGGLNIPNIVDTPNRIRKVLFSGMGLYDYDMSNSHLAIFYNLCQDIGMDCTNLKAYLDNKTEYREKWGEDFFVDIKKLKPYIISWLYGNSNSPVSPNPFFKSLGYDRMKWIKEDNLLSGIYDEFVRGRRLIVEKYRQKDGLITNAMGKSRISTTLSKDLCFILFGYEAKIMEIVNQQIGDDMICLIYDGWIGKKVNVSLLEAEIQKQLGLSISFDEELIEAPTLL
jgi:hypothetical protein